VAERLQCVRPSDDERFAQLEERVKSLEFYRRLEVVFCLAAAAVTLVRAALWH
jgi:hypothetical protein